MIYLIENCIKDFDTLKRVNAELKYEMNLSSDNDVNYLGIQNRCIHGYLIIKVASLFDRDKRSVSFYGVMGNKIDNIKKGIIIDKMIKTRNKFIAHNDFRYLEESKSGLSTIDIIDSNLKELLEFYHSMLRKIDTL